MGVEYLKKSKKNKKKAYKITDGRGLYLLVTQSGKYWRYNFRFAGKQKTLSLGVYPDVVLGNARKAHQQAREQLAEGIDPSETKKVAKIARHQAAVDSFEAIAAEWFEYRM